MEQDGAKSLPRLDFRNGGLKRQKGLESGSG